MRFLYKVLKVEEIVEEYIERAEQKKKRAKQLN